MHYAELLAPEQNERVTVHRVALLMREPETARRVTAVPDVDPVGTFDSPARCDVCRTRPASVEDSARPARLCLSCSRWHGGDHARLADPIDVVERRRRPLVVGAGNDIVAGAPSGFITQAIGHFDTVTNVTSESSLIGNGGPAVNNAWAWADDLARLVVDPDAR